MVNHGKSPRNEGFIWNIPIISYYYIKKNIPISLLLYPIIMSYYYILLIPIVCCTSLANPSMAKKHRLSDSVPKNRFWFIGESSFSLLNGHILKHPDLF